VNDIAQFGMMLKDKSVFAYFCYTSSQKNEGLTMKKIVLLILLGTVLFAELQQEWATKGFLNKNIKIIDIRTPAEWRETGIVNGSYTLMFFNEKGITKLISEGYKPVKYMK